MTKSLEVFYTRVTKSDFNDWLRFALKLWPKEENVQSTLKDILKSRNQIAFICRLKNDKPVGFANVSIRKDYVNGSNTSPVGFVEGIYVEKKFRKFGIAKRLVHEGEQWVKGKGCTEMGSDALIDNAASHKFHKAIGFREVERVVAFIKKIK